MNIEEYKGVFVFIEQLDGHAMGVGYELIGEATKLAAVRNAQVTAVVLGHNIDGLAARCAEHGADNVILVDDPALETYMTEPYTHALTEVVLAKKPEILLYGATAIGRDMAPRVSARVHTGLTADCTGLAISDEENRFGAGHLMMTRPAFGGNIMATIVCPEFRPQMATVRPGVMQRIETRPGAKAKVENFKVAGLEERKNVEILDIIKKVIERMDVMDAKILISGGRGMGCPENFKILESLAAEFPNATISSSRAAVDAGWQPKDRQVGQTGKTVRPNVYFACGISGAIQHLAGMEESEIIVAINKDPSAPIFEVADFGVVGDALKIIPVLTEAVKRVKAAKEA